MEEAWRSRVQMELKGERTGKGHKQKESTEKLAEVNMLESKFVSKAKVAATFSCHSPKTVRPVTPIFLPPLSGRLLTKHW